MYHLCFYCTFILKKVIDVILGCPTNHCSRSQSHLFLSDTLSVTN